VRRDLVLTSAFSRAARRLEKKNRAAFAAIRDTLHLLQEDAFAPRLATHKLKGGLSGQLACSAGYDLRIVFEITQRDGREVVLLTSCGTHDEVY
jgi:mRNA-degrading endonuclease YafQ of YafQ-DinJ toxin-antitoxin module